MTYKQHDVEITKEVETSPRDGVRYTHPSYGMISVSRQSGGDEEPLFGSEVGSSTRMSITISKASVIQDLGQNWYSDNQVITEIIMSPIQYAEMISNPNTQGMPCTIKYTQELGSIKYRGVDTQTQYVESKLETEVSNLKKVTNGLGGKVDAILSQKGIIRKSDREAISSLVSELTRFMSDKLPFYEKCLGEQIDRMKAEARTEIDGYMTHTIMKTGLRALQNPETLALIMKEGQTNE